jgi:serralysin
MALARKVAPVSNSKALNQEIDGVLSGKAWDAAALGNAVSYSFPNSDTDYGNGYAEASSSHNFRPFTVQQQAATRAVLANIEAVTLLSFVEYTAQQGPTADAQALIRFGRTDMTPEAWSYYPTDQKNGGDAWFTTSESVFAASPAVGSYSYELILHETGHTVGLKHSFENGSFGPVPIDSLEYSVMSYSSYPGALDWYIAGDDFPQTYMMYDVAGLQYMYGADYSTNAGNTTYQWNPATGALTTSSVLNGNTITTNFDAPNTDTIFMTVWDGSGVDTFDFSNYTANDTSGLHVDIRPGGWTTVSQDQLADLDGSLGDIVAAGNIAVALESVGPDGKPIAQYIENVVGAATDDIIIGNKVANRIAGGGGSDTITGGGGPDVLFGAQQSGSVQDSVGDLFTYGAVGDSDNAAGQFDTIWYFESGLDHIDLRGLGFTLGELSFQASGHSGSLFGNVDGLGAAELRIEFVNLVSSFNLQTDVLI